MFWIFLTAIDIPNPQHELLDIVDLKLWFLNLQIWFQSFPSWLETWLSKWRLRFETWPWYLWFNFHFRPMIKPASSDWQRVSSPTCRLISPPLLAPSTGHLDLKITALTLNSAGVLWRLNVIDVLMVPFQN